MKNNYLKITEAVAAGIREKVKAFDVDTIEKVKKAKDVNGSFDVIISTDDLDRSGEIVKQDGWDFGNYKNNPIVLWGHDYFSLPIGICTYIAVEGNKTRAQGIFFPADINPLAQQVRLMYDFGMKQGVGVGCTTSVGFIPKEFDEKNNHIITKAELLEFSFVPIPANQGVGPGTTGRALTEAEARELKLDIAVLKTKGLDFSKIKTTGEQAGDSCQMDDGTLGVLSGDPLVCVPNDQDKKANMKKTNEKFTKTIDAEHDRHKTACAACTASFKEAVAEDQGDPKDPDEKKAQEAKAKKNAHVTKCVKDFKLAIDDEHDMHRSKMIEAFRSFKPTEEKSFDQSKHLKALRAQHKEYGNEVSTSLDKFEEKCKTVQGLPGETDEHTDWIVGKMEKHQGAHQKAVGKIAKALCEDAFGEGEDTEEKTIAAVAEILKPYLDEKVLAEVSEKIAQRLTGDTKKKLDEVRSHMQAARIVLRDLSGDPADELGEEGRSEGAGDGTGDGPQKNGSKPQPTSPEDPEAFKAFLQIKEIVGGIEAVAREALGQLNAGIKAYRPQPQKKVK